MNVTFYYDPSCPWSWVTSRWLQETAIHRDITLTFAPFSLALKNNELAGKNTTEHAGMHRESHRVLRVVESVSREYGPEAVPVLYSKFGQAYHNNSETPSNELTMRLLTECAYNTAHAAAADDTSFDEALQTSLNMAVKTAGDDVGVPLLVVSDGTSQKAFFGPVLGSLPDTEAGLQLWDNLAGLLNVDAFYELKSRRLSPVNPGSTARLF